MTDMHYGVRIGFSTSQAWISRAIRWFTSSRVSHAFLIAFDPLWGCDVVIEAWWTGVREIPLEKWRRENTLVSIYRPPVPLEDALQRHRLDLATRYAFLGIVGMAWTRVCFWFGRKVRNPWHSGAALFCSEWVLEIADTAGWPGSYRLDPPSTSPDVLERFAAEHGGTLVGT
jgi:hypothetical protein